MHGCCQLSGGLIRMYNIICMARNALTYSATTSSVNNCYHNDLDTEWIDVLATSIFPGQPGHLHGVVEKACMHGSYSHADNVQSIMHIWPSVVYNNNDGCCAYNKRCCYNIHSVTIIDVKGKTTAGKKTTGRKTKAAGKNVTGRKTAGNKAAGKILRVAKSWDGGNMLIINEDHAQLCMPVALAAIYNYYYNDQINSIFLMYLDIII